MLCQYLQDPPDCSFVFLFWLRKDQNIVQVHHYDPFGYKSSEDVIHHSLEGGGAVGHSKEHHKRFEEAAVGAKGCFPFISGLNAYVIETPADIKFYEVLGSVELGDEFGDKGEGVSVLDSYSIQRAIVLDQPERTIFLLNEEHRGCYGGLGRPDASSTQVFLQKGI